ncbi:MAG: tetratricopeptide repeat protein [Aureliella sp.]
MSLSSLPNVEWSACRRGLLGGLGGLRWRVFALACWCCWLASGPATGSAQAADLDEAVALFHRGEYDQCIAMTRGEVDRGIWHDGWSKLLMRALMVKGEYQAAAEVYMKVAEKFSASIPLRMLGVEALRFSGRHAEARKLLSEIPTMLQTAPWRFSDRDNMVALGNYFLSQGEDAREVLDVFFDRTLKSDPKFVDAHIAIAELALSKNDYQEAVNSLNQAEKLSPEDPHIEYLLARAWSPSDSEKATAALAAALKLNPHHADSLLMQCETLLDAERFDAAEERIEQVLELNPKHPKAWALRAVIKHLRGKYEEEGECRSKALATWPQNPAVDYEIGRKLSRFYRFADAATYLRRSISLDPTYAPARFQLAQDLLRLGATDEGWTLVDQVTQADKYNVVAANLRTLRERLSQFTTLKADGFIVRMDAREARIYGDRVLGLLGEAKRVLCAKYDHAIEEPINVEIFPQQSDFAIRTFGLPGGAGFLGVCFGKLITANSPASQGETPSNWESVLWHEFCHVVTLQKTKNRMPRWLSEGISVYEELQRDPSWGQSMNPTYREMLLGDQFVPLSKLSSAFMQPPSPMHLQFAYFESSLAVRYLVERHGIERLKRLLVDLGQGVPMEEALERSYGQADALDADFQKYAIGLANELFDAEKIGAEKIDDEELPARLSVEELQAFVKEHPTHYLAGRQLAQRLMADQQWDDALGVLKQLDKLWSEDAESGGTLESLAAVYRKLERTDDEQAALERLVKHSSDNVPALLRLIELAEEAEDWQRVADWADRLLAVQPLITAGHTALAEAASHRSDPAAAAEAYQALLDLEPLDPGRLHYQLAQAQVQLDRWDDARRHLLIALEETPRYRAAQRLLVEVAAHRRGLAGTTKTLAVPGADDRPPAPVAKGR